jgi:tRNA G46 methylase TrmB
MSAQTVFLQEQISQPIRPPFLSLALPVVVKCLEIARLNEDNLIYDLGCGDGRFLIEGAVMNKLSNFFCFKKRNQLCM